MMHEKFKEYIDILEGIINKIATFHISNYFYWVFPNKGTFRS